MLRLPRLLCALWQRLSVDRFLRFRRTFEIGYCQEHQGGAERHRCRLREPVLAHDDRQQSGGLFSRHTRKAIHTAGTRKNEGSQRHRGELFSEVDCPWWSALDLLGASPYAGSQRHTALHRRRDQTRRRCLLSAP